MNRDWRHHIAVLVIGYEDYTGVMSPNSNHTLSHGVKVAFVSKAHDLLYRVQIKTSDLSPVPQVVGPNNHSPSLFVALFKLQLAVKVCVSHIIPLLLKDTRQ
jgi:hypothetical protein